jgi:hypothetical protein
VTLRAALYANTGETKNATMGVQGQGNKVAPTGFGGALVPSLITAVGELLEQFYWGMPLPQAPISYEHVAKADRNAQIHARHQAGDTLEEIASMCGISVQRVHQIINRRQN